MNERGLLGKTGEDIAAEHLIGRGYRILQRNYRCKAGEIDIVAGRGRTVVFCEVKTRRTDRWGQPSEAVGHLKQGRLRRLAATWLAEHEVRASNVRFDVFSVVADKGRPVVTHIEDAF